jgi:hypothetical protein
MLFLISDVSDDRVIDVVEADTVEAVSKAFLEEKKALPNNSHFKSAHKNVTVMNVGFMDAGFGNRRNYVIRPVKNQTVPKADAELA